MKAMSTRDFAHEAIPARLAALRVSNGVCSMLALNLVNHALGG
jgi:hypothetical protein